MSYGIPVQLGQRLSIYDPVKQSVHICFAVNYKLDEFIVYFEEITQWEQCRFSLFSEDYHIRIS